MGLVFLALSLTPSLLPRSQTSQGAISGLSFALGYAVGVLLWSGVKALVRWRHESLTRWGWPLLGIVLVTGAIILAPFVVAWQNGIRTTVGLATIPGYSWFQLLAVAFGVAMLAIAVGRGLRLTYRAIERRTGTVVFRVAGEEGLKHQRALQFGAEVSAIFIFATAVIVAVAVIIVGGLQVLDRGWSASNALPDPALNAPTSALRSGSAQSLVSWNEVGNAGAEIVTSGPDAVAIEALTKRSALEPIRVYVGLAAAPTYAERAAIAVNELQRTGAAHRDVLIVAGTTGTGWLDSQAIDGVEYLHGGDTALVAVEYDDKPSWRSRVFSPDIPTEGTSAQFYSVYSWWSALPADDRPRLYVYGLSLGSYAMQSAFPDLDTLLARTDGAVFAGTPSGTRLWETVTAQRDEGSPVVLPTLDRGRQVRWFSSAGGVDRLTSVWEQPRVAYLQNGNDPVTWLSASIFWQKPEWLEDGQRSPVVSSDMHWIPIVTGLQAFIDYTMGSSVPDKAGHLYGTLTLEAWIAVTGDDGLDIESVDAIRAVIASQDTLAPLDQ